MLFYGDQDQVSLAADQMVDSWPGLMLVDDLDGGVRRMRWRGETWLPREAREPIDQYSARLLRSDLYPGLTDALDRAVAKPFSRTVTVEGLPPELEAMLANIDGQGSDVTQFARRWLRASIKHGLAHCLVDFTARDPAAPATRAAEQAAQPRPFFSLIEHSSILGWREAVLPDGTLALSELRWRELRTVHEGSWIARKREYIRVLRLDSWELWENKLYRPWGIIRAADAEFYDWQENRESRFELVASGAFGPEGGFEALPVVTVYTSGREFMVARPAFADLAETNLTHWQSSSDQRNIAHFARVPILFARGMLPEETSGGLTIGSGMAITSQSDSANLQFVEHSGMAVTTGQEDLDRLERRMEQLGGRPFVERTGAVTATSHAIAEAGATTDVQAWIRAMETGLMQAFVWAGRWKGSADEAVQAAQAAQIDIFSDFAVVLTGNADLAELRTMHEKGYITLETYLREVKRRGLFSDAVNVDEEIEAVKGDDERNIEASMRSERQESETSVGAVTAEKVAEQAPEEIQKLALNGAQITALQGVVVAVADGELPYETALELIVQGFPQIPRDAVVRILSPARGFTPKQQDNGNGTIIAEGNPYRIEKRGDKFVVIKVLTGQVMGTHDTREKALAQLQALEANEKD